VTSKRHERAGSAGLRINDRHPWPALRLIAGNGYCGTLEQKMRVLLGTDVNVLRTSLRRIACSGMSVSVSDRRPRVRENSRLDLEAMARIEDECDGIGLRRHFAANRRTFLTHSRSARVGSIHHFEPGIASNWDMAWRRLPDWEANHGR